MITKITSGKLNLNLQDFIKLYGGSNNIAILIPNLLKLKKNQRNKIN